MANKEQRKGNREARKTKQPKAKPAPATSAFIVTAGKITAGDPKKR
ncbi:MAG: hypothetical protein JSR45_16095 [Proteobacteria bacterium]|nr:hypothetical protein [Pseudomonadota bacterium]